MREAPGGSASSDEASGFVPPFSGWEVVWRQSEAPASGGAPSPRLWDAALWSRQGLLKQHCLLAVKQAVSPQW